MIDLNVIGYPGNNVASFTAANTTQAKILIDVQAAQVVAAVTGETALPGETGIRQRVLQGGFVLIDGTITSTDGTARAALLYEAVQTTLYANMGVAATTATSNSTVTRTVGSFITDGYQIGDTVMLFGATSNGNNGLPSSVTAVAALTLTVSGTTGIPTAETQAAGFRIVRVGTVYRKPIAITAGTDGTTVPVPVLGGTLDPRTQTSPLTSTFGANGMLLMGMQATISALPAKVDVNVKYWSY